MLSYKEILRCTKNIALYNQDKIMQTVLPSNNSKQTFTEHCETNYCITCKVLKKISLHHDSQLICLES